MFCYNKDTISQEEAMSMKYDAIVQEILDVFCKSVKSALKNLVTGYVLVSPSTNEGIEVQIVKDDFGFRGQYDDVVHEICTNSDCKRNIIRKILKDYGLSINDYFFKKVGDK